MRSPADFEAVLALVRAGHSDGEIARTTGVPRQTVNRWRNHGRQGRRSHWDLMEVEGWRPSDGSMYCYLLGLYLGDGHLSGLPRGTPRLRITLPTCYPGLIEEATKAIGAVVPAVRIHRIPLPSAAIVLDAAHPVWTIAFPQHGPGRKHERTIELLPWQQELTHAHPEALLRGLIHSDGSRTVNRFTTRLLDGRDKEYAYVRYFFTNCSADIMRIFGEHCELIGVRCTRSNERNLSIAHRDSVAILDAIAGPKQ